MREKRDKKGLLYIYMCVYVCVRKTQSNTYNKKKPKILPKSVVNFKKTIQTDFGVWCI